MRVITLSDDVASAVFLALENSTDGTVTPPVVPPIVAPVIPEPPKPAMSVQALVDYLGANASDLAQSPGYGRVVEFAQRRPDLLTPEQVLAEFRKTLAPAAGQPTQTEDKMWNAGRGFPVGYVIQAYDQGDKSHAFYLFRRGQQLGHPLYYQVLEGPQSQIGALIQRIGVGNDLVEAQNFNTADYNGPLKGFVDRFVEKGFVLAE